MNSDISTIHPIGVSGARPARPVLGWTLAILGTLLALQTFFVVMQFPGLIPWALVGGVVGSLMIAAASTLIAPHDS